MREAYRPDPTAPSARGGAAARPSARTGLFVALLVAAGVAWYANGLRVPFVFDDEEAIRDNPTIATWAPDGPVTRRVAYLTFKLNHRLGGLRSVRLPRGQRRGPRPGGDRGVVDLSRAPRGAAGDGERARSRAAWAALAGALVFVVHPIQTQAVT